MKHKPTVLLALLTALSLAACGPKRNDATTTGGTGSETGTTGGATGGAYDSTATGTPSDTSHAGMDSTTK